jgi:hypothetical protein
MRVLKGKEIEEDNQNVEKDMIELMILEAVENTEKYQKETKKCKDRKVVRKDIKIGDLVLKKRRIGRTLENSKNHEKGRS